jgi:hypothetical protein
MPLHRKPGLEEELPDILVALAPQQHHLGMIDRAPARPICW